MKLLLLILLMPIFLCGQKYTSIDGKVVFISDAPLEIIKASSNQLQGVVDKDNQVFAFKIYIKSFDGFNNPLQKEHFYENYMEIGQFPTATFSGKILEEITQERRMYRAKGRLNVHGVSVERIIDVSLSFNKEKIIYNTNFDIALVDHDIDLPRIVYQKISENISVNVSGELQRR